MVGASEARAKILYLVTEDWYFCSHRLPIARAARDAGFDVVVATRVNAHANVITGEGFSLVPIGMRRRRTRPWHELATLIELYRVYRAARPAIVHHVAMKPVIYGSIVARLAGVGGVVNALAGLGFVFTSGGFRAAILRPLVRVALRLALGGAATRIIVQNPDDAAVLRSLGVESRRIVIIRGSGVDPSRFRPSPEPPVPVVVTLVSRMLWDKGVLELVESARILKRRGVEARVRLVGDPDPENPASIEESQLELWRSEGIIEWMGHCKDVARAWAESHIAVLPSYREGLPKSLLEAAACGRPIVATDVPGCREIVDHGVNGLLIPPKDAQALSDAIQRLIEQPDLRRRMGERGRARVVELFTEERVVQETLAVYRSIAALV